SEFDAEHFQKLVKDKLITEKEKDDLYFIFEAANLGGDNLPFISALRSASVKSLKDLAGWTESDLLKFMKEHKVAAPENIPEEEYAGNIAVNLERSFPTLTLMHRSAKRARAISE